MRNLLLQQGHYSACKKLNSTPVVSTAWFHLSMSDVFSLNGHKVKIICFMLSGYVVSKINPFPKNVANISVNISK